MMVTIVIANPATRFKLWDFCLALLCSAHEPLGTGISFMVAFLICDTYEPLRTGCEVRRPAKTFSSLIQAFQSIQ